MKFVFIAKHRNIWPVAWLCDAMGVSRSGFHAWLNRSPSDRSRSDEAVGRQVRASFLASDRTYGARRVWHDVLAEGVECGLHRIERLMRLQALRARPRRRRLPKDEADRQLSVVPSNILDRQFEADRPNQKWIADFTYIWTAEGWQEGRRCHEGSSEKRGRRPRVQGRRRDFGSCRKERGKSQRRSRSYRCADRQKE